MSQQNPSPIISTVALAIVAQLQTYASERGGIVEAVENEDQLITKLWANGTPDERPQIYVLNMGETARGEFAGGERTNMHRVDRHWMVICMRGHGFKNMTFEGQGQENTPGYFEPFTDSLETIRDGIRVLQGISEEYPNDYTDMVPLPSAIPVPSQMATIFQSVRAIRFNTAADIPAVGPGYTM